ncbi:hypothetical protein SAMN04489712_103199 [Thermomonospora echinospora]|uniref:Uncharacterized protein n=1 Tax=Thermomonospora echinospora TaxID=1992 RepID=A0A1H5XD00_9ACTN|nr:hypothetical protein [Thermomonospora echinospora]SEG09622.1 hypothetical protein SAMN04489712_103199 [Thermomonospora echinospora]
MTERRYGRHAKPPSRLRVRCDRLIDAALSERDRRKVIAIGTGSVSAVLLAVAGGAVLWLPGSGAGPSDGLAAQAAARQATPSPTVTVTTATGAGADPDQVPDAEAFFLTKDPGRKVAGHVEDVRRSGSFLRVYTDLREGDENSKPAISLCEWTAEFLREHVGEGEPIVFVHAKENDNGHVVLANKQSADDDCRVGETR